MPRPSPSTSGRKMCQTCSHQPKHGSHSPRVDKLGQKNGSSNVFTEENCQVEHPTPLVLRDASLTPSQHLLNTLFRTSAPTSLYTRFHDSTTRKRIMLRYPPHSSLPFFRCAGWQTVSSLDSQNLKLGPKKCDSNVGGAMWPPGPPAPPSGTTPETSARFRLCQQTLSLSPCGLSNLCHHRSSLPLSSVFVIGSSPLSLSLPSHTHGGRISLPAVN